MEIHQIRYFLAVADALNFTKAAERCHVTQPALTRAIQKLEEEFGGPLLRRERNLTHLTDLGRMMVPHFERVLEGSEAARTTASGFLNLDKAPLRLGVMCTIGPQRCVGLLAHFNRRHPGVEIELHESVPSRLLDELLEGRHDIAILAMPEAIDGRFAAVPLYRERFVVALPPGHRLSNSTGVRMTDLDGERYLSRINCEYYDYLRNLRRSQGLLSSTPSAASARTGFRAWCLRAWESASSPSTRPSSRASRPGRWSTRRSCARSLPSPSRAGASRRRWWRSSARCDATPGPASAPTRKGLHRFQQLVNPAEAS